MASQAHGTVGQHLHPLITAKRLEVAEIELKPAVLRRHDLRSLTTIGVLAVRCESPNFAFIAIFRVADELANHGVDAAQRMRKKSALQHFDLITLAARHHRRNEVTGTVITEASRLLPWRAVVRARNVGDVVFEMVLLK